MVAPRAALGANASHMVEVVVRDKHVRDRETGPELVYLGQHRLRAKLVERRLEHDDAVGRT